LLSLAKDTPAQPVHPDLVEHLRRKGLIGGPWANQDHIFSPLFAEFVRCQQSAPARHIYVDRARRVVWVDGLEARGLTRLEFRLIEYLDEHRGEVCSLDALATHLYPTDVSLGGAGVTDERIETLVRRLRRKIEPHPKEPKYVVTVRGHGFCLEDADETETPVSRD
jgi:DNA-binding response OmpR family regulator